MWIRRAAVLATALMLGALLYSWYAWWFDVRLSRALQDTFSRAAERAEGAGDGAGRAPEGGEAAP
ncbi:MAG TPA: hypothetical protein VHG08_01505 [Longimicrobium sp.]|nr:hypothetical protein [Longimicrobium sp.]